MGIFELRRGKSASAKDAYSGFSDRSHDLSQIRLNHGPFASLGNYMAQPECFVSYPRQTAINSGFFPEEVFESNSRQLAAIFLALCDQTSLKKAKNLRIPRLPPIGAQRIPSRRAPEASM
jgi:hypothetical protein